VAAVVVVLLGVAPGFLLELAEQSAATLLRVPAATVGLQLIP
jgi:hypothetical protein